MKVVKTNPDFSESFTMDKSNNYCISIEFLTTIGMVDSIRVKLTDIRFEDGPRRPCFLRALSNSVLSECPIEVNGWYSIGGPFQISRNETITFACISIWGYQVAGLLEARIESIEFILGLDRGGKDIDASSITEQSALLALHSIDPLGITLRKEDHFVKLIREQSSHSWKTLIESIAFKQSVITGAILPPTTIETGDVHFTHAAISNPVWGGSYLLTFRQLKSFAKQVLSLMEELIRHDDGAYCLIDAHAGNFSQTGYGKFSMLDYGSIANFVPDIARGGLKNLIRMILLPLAICARKDNLFFNQSNHLSVIGVEIDGQVIDAMSSLQMITDTLKIPFSHCQSIPEFIDLFNRLNQWVDSLTRPANVDFWSNYNPNNFDVERIAQSMRYLIDPDQKVSDISNRDQTVVELLSAMNYTSLIDLGCNTGKFSVYAALLGYQVSAIDSNEEVVDALFEFAASESMPISAFCGSVFQNGFNCDADVVLALALTHHLILGEYSPERQKPNSMSDVCARISDLAKKAALIEFMPLGMGSAVNNFLPAPHPLPDWYTVNNFELTLNNYFSSVTKVEYEGDANLTRVLFVCEK